MMIFISSLFAQLQNIEISQEFLKKGIKIIDIRTPSEWKETGIVKDSYTLMFFNEQGGYDTDTFIRELNKIVKKDEQFALICRTGSRTSMIAQFLSKELGYDVINLKSGIMKLLRDGYQTTPYKVSPLFIK